MNSEKPDVTFERVDISALPDAELEDVVGGINIAAVPFGPS
jgi:hypothetical protein